MLSYSPTPIISLDCPGLPSIALSVKREDLNHPTVSGNKWWKLKYNIAEAKKNNFKVLLTFGGAYSNHIYATAAAARELGLQSIGIIRGEETLPLNPTLSFAKSCGMELHYLSRSEYRNKTEPTFIEALRARFGDFYLIPEGGTNALAVQGVREFAQALEGEHVFDYVFCAMGTGGTVSGLVSGLSPGKHVIGVPVLKNGSFLQEEIEKWIQPSHRHATYELLTEYHHGGYAKTTPRLLEFIQDMYHNHQLPLDPIYTGKLLWAVVEEARKGRFKEGDRVLALHTGGLQGGGPSR